MRIPIRIWDACVMDPAGPKFQRLDQLNSEIMVGIILAGAVFEAAAKGALESHRGLNH